MLCQVRRTGIRAAVKVCAVPWPKNKWICPAGIMSFSDVQAAESKVP